VGLDDDVRAAGLALRGVRDVCKRLRERGNYGLIGDASVGIELAAPVEREVTVSGRRSATGDGDAQLGCPVGSHEVTHVLARRALRELGGALVFLKAHALKACQLASAPASECLLDGVCVAATARGQRTAGRNGYAPSVSHPAKGCRYLKSADDGCGEAVEPAALHESGVARDRLTRFLESDTPLDGAPLA
jgi:hypothetical protein